MPYKDKEAQKKAVKRAVQKHRKGITKEGITPGNVTNNVIPLDEGQALHHGASPGATVLSDGQLWYQGNNGYHPKDCHCTAHKDRSLMFDWCYAYRITKQGKHLLHTSSQ